MRRCLAALAAAALLLSVVGGATGAEPPASGGSSDLGSPRPSPTVEPSREPVASPAESAAPVDREPAGSPLEPHQPAASEPASVAPDDIPSTVAAPGPPSADLRDPADPTDRWIVVLKPGTNTAAARDRQEKRIGFRSDRTFAHAIHGYAARMSRSRVEALRRDPSVAMIVADERIELAGQLLPTGITRVGANRSAVAHIDGVDDRVDADIAIVDTGIASVPELNVAGGYNCSTSNRAAWRDVYGHGTHVAGTAAAIDNGSGVVGVAPGARLWAVKILDDSGSGLLSWYVCGLDWIAAQHDPNDPTRPLIEAVNMSVAKWGSDDASCGLKNRDVLHQAICRLVAAGVTVVAAAGNDAASAAARVPASYNEVITVSALADTDGKPGGLGGHRCYSWGSYDADDTLANFSNEGGDVDLIAPGKCIWSTVPGGYKYSSGTSMAAPHVTGAAALLKATRPEFSPVEVKEALQYLGNLNWKTSTDRDSHHERLLDVSRLGPRGDFSLSSLPGASLSEAGGVARFPISLTRTTTSFERVRLSVADLPDGFIASFSPTSLYGFSAVASTLSVTVPAATPLGTYSFTVTASEHGNVRSIPASITVAWDTPVAQPPSVAALAKAVLGTTTLPTRVSWPAASDPSTPIAGYEYQSNVDGGAWTASTATSGSVRTATASHVIGHAYQYRVRARDSVGNWSDWADGPSVTTALVQDRSSSVVYGGSWKRVAYSIASGGTTTYATAAGARARTTFSGRGVALVAPLGPTRGSARIYVDGAYRTTISFKASAGKSRVVMYSRTFPTLGTHTIEVRLTGSGRVDVDAFVILR